MQYHMRGKTYSLPPSASAICGEEEASRIRWLATYAQNDRLFQASRALIQEYDQRSIDIPDTTGKRLKLPALLFKNKQNTWVTNVPSLSDAHHMRDEIVEDVLHTINSAISDEEQKLLLSIAQAVFAVRTDAGEWVNRSLDEVRTLFQHWCQQEHRNRQRAKKKREQEGL